MVLWQESALKAPEGLPKTGPVGTPEKLASPEGPPAPVAEQGRALRAHPLPYSAMDLDEDSNDTIPPPQQPNAVVLLLPTTKHKSRSASPQNGPQQGTQAGSAGGGFGSLVGQRQAGDSNDTRQNEDAALQPAKAPAPGVSSIRELEHRLAVERLNRVRARVAAFESIAGQGRVSPTKGAAPRSPIASAERVMAVDSPVVNVGRLSVRVPKTTDRSGAERGAISSQSMPGSAKKGLGLWSTEGPSQGGQEGAFPCRASVGAADSETAAQVRARVAKFETIAHQTRSLGSPVLSSAVAAGRPA